VQAAGRLAKLLGNSGELVDDVLDVLQGSRGCIRLGRRAGAEVIGSNGVGDVILRGILRGPA
jgi:hypothetical protein